MFHSLTHSLVDSCLCPNLGLNPQPWLPGTTLQPTELPARAKGPLWAPSSHAAGKLREAAEPAEMSGDRPRRLRGRLESSSPAGSQSPPERAQLRPRGATELAGLGVVCYSGTGHRNIDCSATLVKLNINTYRCHEHPPTAVRIDQFIYFNDCVVFHGADEAEFPYLSPTDDIRWSPTLCQNKQCYFFV